MQGELCYSSLLDLCSQFKRGGELVKPQRERGSKVIKTHAISVAEVAILQLIKKKTENKTYSWGF